MPVETEAPASSRGRRRKRAPGGWLMVEVGVGGVMASVVLASLLANVGDSMRRTVVVGRELTAGMLCQQGIEQARAVQNPVTSLADGNNVDIGVPGGLTGTYARTRTITSGTDTVGALPVVFKDVQVTVTFPTSEGITKTVKMETRIYQAGNSP